MISLRSCVPFKTNVFKGKTQSERVRAVVDRKVRGVVDGTKQRLNRWKGEVGKFHTVLSI
jgi:hypothetical protein